MLVRDFYSAVVALFGYTNKVCFAGDVTQVVFLTAIYFTKTLHNTLDHFQFSEGSVVDNVYGLRVFSQGRERFTWKNHWFSLNMFEYD